MAAPAHATTRRQPTVRSRSARSIPGRTAGVTGTRLLLALVLAAATWVALPTTPAGADHAGAPVGTTNVPNLAGSIATPDGSTCLIEEGVGLRCFGSNIFGQLGNGVADSSGGSSVSQYDATPITIPGGDPVQVVGDHDHVCALAADGTVSCWGRNEFGQVAGPIADAVSTPRAVALPDDARALSISAGRDISCAVLDDGDVACWGDNGSNGLGDGEVNSDPVTTPVRAEMPAGRAATKVTVGDNVMCAVLDDGQVSCWGRNADAQALGSGDVQLTPSAPVRIGGGDVVAIDAGGRTVCAVVDDGTLWCWGRGIHNGVGAPPAQVPLGGGRLAAAVGVQFDHACVVATSGEVGCWGSNDDGLLGVDDDAVTEIATPFNGPDTRVAFGEDHSAIAVVVGINHVCAAFEDRSATCWGQGFDGELGFDVGTFDTGDFSVHVEGPTSLIGHPLTGVVDVDTGLDSTCAVTDDGDVHCWGLNDDSQLGRTGAASALAGPALNLPGGAEAIDVAVGSGTACALTNVGGVACWGRNSQGQTGQPASSSDVTSPTDIPLKLGEVYEEIGVGQRHACGRQQTTVKCWGDNSLSQLGNNGQDSFDDVLRPGGTAFTSLAVGSLHSCGVLDDDSAVCWGWGTSGRLGDGQETDNSTGQTRITLPLVIPPLDVSEIAAGWNHTCVDLSSGQAGCFGQNSRGQLGTGDTTQRNAVDSTAYVVDSPIVNLRDLALGGAHSCAIQTSLLNGSVVCWGDTAENQLGNGADPASLAQTSIGDATPMPGGQLPTVLDAGFDSTCAVLPDTTVTCWGEHDSGQLGQGLIRDGSTPRAGARVLERPVLLAPSTLAAPADPVGDALVPTDPARFWDSRERPTFDGQFSDTGRLADGAVQKLRIAGRGDVPADATAIVGNLVVIGPDRPGFATIYPCTPDVPTASTLNYGPGDVVANNSVVPLDSNGDVCVFTLRGAHYALDVNGYAPGDSPLVAIEPARFLETRADRTTFDGQAQGDGRPADGETVEVQIAGRGSIPADATAAIVNATVVFPDGPGFATLSPCGDRPDSSSINYAPGTVTPNGAVAALSSTGTLCIFTLRSADVLIDVSGYVPAGVDSIATITPARVLETRDGRSTVDDVSNGTGRVEAGEVAEVQITGRAGVPAGATAAILNLAVIFADGPGFATLYPCGDRPEASNLNFRSGQVLANNAIARLSATGSICLFSLTGADYVLDVAGWLQPT